MSELKLDYSTFALIVVGLFALSGFFRGWWREGISTVFLVSLAFMLTQPQQAQNLISALNNALSSALSVIRGVTGVPLAGGTVSAASTNGLLNPQQRDVYILILIGAVVLSYFTGRVTLGDREITAGGRILGGVLGAVNGYLIINLFKEYVLGRFLPGGAGMVSAQAVTAPATLAVSVANVPPDTPFTASTQLLVFGFGGLMFILLLSTRLRKSLWGYGAPKVPKKKKEE